jgi:hypothetical protein
MMTKTLNIEHDGTRLIVRRYSDGITALMYVDGAHGSITLNGDDIEALYNILRGE